MLLLNLVEHACSVGMLGTVGFSGAGCWLIRDMFAVARLFGRCLVISSAVRPGHVEKFPLLIAEINVVGTGEKADRW